MAPGPWDEWLEFHDTAPYERIAAALRQDGRHVLARTEGGRPGKTLTATYDYDCGCRRTYKADLRTLAETEHLTACPIHVNLVNLLTGSPGTGTMSGTQQEG